MKASLKLRDQQGQLQKPVIKVKLPLHILGFPIYTGFKIFGHIQEVSLRLGSSLESLGPSLELSYRPNQTCDAFALGLKAGFRPWSSSPSPSISVSAEFNLSSPANPSFMLRIKPEIGDFSIRHDFKSEGVRVHDHQTLLDKHPDVASPCSSSSSNIQHISSSSRYASKQCDFGNPWGNDHRNVQCFDNTTFPLSQADNDAFALSNGNKQPHAVRTAGCADTNHNAVFDVRQPPPPHLNIKQNVKYDTINFPYFDTTPHASESSDFTGIDAIQSRVSPLDFFVQERNPQSVYRYKSNDADSDPFLNYRYCQSTPRSNGVCDTPPTNRIWDTPFEVSSTASIASSNQKNNANPDSDCITSWGDHSIFKGNRLRACTRLPISTEAQLKIWWSVSTLKSSPKLPALPILVLDKISLEGLKEASHPQDSSSENHFTGSRSCSENITNWKHCIQGDLNPASQPYVQYPNKNETPFWETFISRKGLMD